MLDFFSQILSCYKNKSTTYFHKDMTLVSYFYDYPDAIAPLITNYSSFKVSIDFTHRLTFRGGISDPAQIRNKGKGDNGER